MAKNMALTGELIKEKGRQFLAIFVFPIDSLKILNGWLAKFQKRHQLSSHCIYGESGSVNTIALNEALPEIKQNIARYDPSDFYNMDETGLFYCCTRNRTMFQDRIEGRKADKTQIKIAFTTNADGSHKPDPFFISHAKRPYCFRNKSGTELGLVYNNDKKAWMTGVQFEEWLVGVNK